MDDTTKDIESFAASQVDELLAWLHLGAYSLPIPYSSRASGFTAQEGRYCIYIQAKGLEIAAMAVGQ